MANPKRKVHKGTWPTEIKQDGVYVTFHALICTSRQQEKTYFFLMGSNLSGLKTSGSTKCSGIWHIAPVDIWKRIPHCYLQVYIYRSLLIEEYWEYRYPAAISSAYSDLCALWDLVATKFNSTRARTPSNPPDWWIHTESFKENL